MKSDYLNKIMAEIKERVELLEIYISSREEAKADILKSKMKVYSWQDNICNISEREM